MNGKEYRIEVFQNSQKKIQEETKLMESLKKSVEKQKFYNDIIDCSTDKICEQTKVHITKSRTMEAGRKWCKVGNTAVHNFASATNPGGGVVKGSSAQEECLCRVSTLYNCLNDAKCWDMYYNVNRAAKDCLHTDSIIYTPKVCVFSDDDYKALESKDYFYVDVITCAAPNLREVPNNGWCNIGEDGDAVHIDDEKLYNIHVKRALNIMKSAKANNIKNLVLGAFGCGAFRNNPEVVAKAYKDVVEKCDGWFENIEFAIYCKDYETQNYDAFVKAFRS